MSPTEILALPELLLGVPPENVIILMMMFNMRYVPDTLHGVAAVITAVRRGGV